MSVGRVILIASVLIVIVAAAALFFLWTSLDSLVAAAIETYGSEVTQTDVEVASVTVKLRSGEGVITGLSIGNPAGFSSSAAVRLGAVSLKIDRTSITADPVVIDEIRVDSPRVLYEINAAGASNIKALSTNVERHRTRRGRSEQAAKPEQDGARTVNLLIKRLVIENGQIDVTIAGLAAEPKTARLPRIELKDIGSGSGAAPREVAERVLSVVLDKVGPAVADLGVREYLGRGIEEVERTVEEAAGEKVRGALEEASEEAGEAVQKLFGR